MSSKMKHRTVFFVSDQTGVTAETLGYSLLTQFEGHEFSQITLPFIDSLEKADEAVQRINAVANEEGVRPIIFSTLVQDDLRDRVQLAKGLFVDFFQQFLAPLEDELHMKSTHTAGMAHGVRNTDSYDQRIEATNFALDNDDGAPDS